MGFESVEGAPAEESVLTRDLEPVDRRSSRVVYRLPVMGTLVSVSTLVRSPDRADQAVGVAFEEMGRLIRIFSHFDAGSAASQLNRMGRLDEPPPELARVAADAKRYHRLTGGGFDISVAPVVELFRDRPAGALPDEADVRAALELVGAERIEISRRRIGFRRQGMRLTLDGIAKGFIVDRMARALERHRIRDYLVEAGGDIRVRGSRGHGRPWRIAVQDPEKGDGDQGAGFPAVIELMRGAVATSGSYENYYDPGREHHHIVSAESGESPQLSRSVTVVAPTAMAADALATSVFLMAPPAGVRFVEALRGSECLVLDHEGAQVSTRGWRGAAPARQGEG
jgi:thiamine biosynthesis lipoprotein